MTQSTYIHAHIYQKKDHSTCGPCCLAMIYTLKGIDYKLAQILKDFHQDEKGAPTQPAQLARHLEKNNLRTKLTISNPRVISPAWGSINKKDLITNLKDWITLHTDNFWLLAGIYTLFYLQEGGTVELASYSTRSLKDMLDKGSLIILCVDEVWLWGHRLQPHTSEINEFEGDSNGHFILVTGYHDNMFYVLDSFPTNIKEKEKSYTVDGNQLVNASLIWSGTILQIYLSKKEASTKLTSKVAK